MYMPKKSTANPAVQETLRSATDLERSSPGFFGIPDFAVGGMFSSLLVIRLLNSHWQPQRIVV